MSTLTPAAIGHDEAWDVDVLRTPGGGVVLLPTTVRRLCGGQLELVRELQGITVGLRQLEDSRELVVSAARSAGVSWGAIGWSVGTTGDAARRRWGIS